MIVRAARDKLQSFGQKSLGQCCGVFYHLCLIGFEFRIQGLSQRYRFGGDHVLQGSALAARENRGINFLGQLLLTKDHAAPGPPEGLVGRCGHHIGIGHGRGVKPSRYQPGNVRHVHKKIGPHLMGNVGKGGKINDPRIGRGSRQNHSGLLPPGQVPHLIVVNAAIFSHTIGNNMVVLSRVVHWGTVGQMPAVGKIHPQHSIPQLTERGIDGIVGLRP